MIPLGPSEANHPPQMQRIREDISLFAKLLREFAFIASSSLPVARMAAHWSEAAVLISEYAYFSLIDCTCEGSGACHIEWRVFQGPFMFDFGEQRSYFHTVFLWQKYPRLYSRIQ